MHINKTFLDQVAVRIAQPSPNSPGGIAGSILTVAAGSYGFRSGPQEELTMPTGFDPHAAALFESIVESAYLVAIADGVFDETERNAFKEVVLEACRGTVHQEVLDALMADLADQLHEDGIDKRVEMIGRTVSRPEHRREVLRIASLFAHVSGDVSPEERTVLDKLAKTFDMPSETVDAVLHEVQLALAGAKPTS